MWPHEQRENPPDHESRLEHVPGRWALVSGGRHLGGRRRRQSAVCATLQPVLVRFAARGIHFFHLPQDSAWQLLPQALDYAEFCQLPFAPAALLQLGPWEENLSRQLSRSREVPANALPQACEAEVAVAIEQVPLWAELPRRQPVVFRFSVPPGVELTVEANGRYTVLEGSGCSQQATVTPVSEVVTVWAGSATGSGTAVKSMVALLQYRVPAIEPLRISRQRRLVSADTVAYLRRRLPLPEN